MSSIYIAGPMTGYEDYNFPAFFRAEESLLAQGYTVVNPARHDMESGFVVLDEDGYYTTAAFNLKECLLWDLAQVAEVDALMMLEGWEASKGANAEYWLAKALHKRVLHQSPVDTLLHGSLLAMKPREEYV